MKKPAGRKLAALRRARTSLARCSRESTGPRPHNRHVSQGYFAGMTAATSLETRLAGSVEYHVGGAGDAGPARPRARRLGRELGRGAAGARRAPPRDRGRPPRPRGLGAARAGRDDGRLRRRRRPPCSTRRASTAPSSRATRSAVSSRCGSRAARPDLVRGLLLVAPAGIATTSRVVRGARARRQRRSGRDGSSRRFRHR